MRKYEAKLVIYELRLGRRIPEFNYCDLVRTEEYIEKGDSSMVLESWQKLSKVGPQMAAGDRT